MKAIPLLLVVLLTHALGSDGWTFEQVDGDSVNINRVYVGVEADGVIHVCYGPSNSRFFHAWKDSIWHREIAVTDPASSMASMAVGRHGEVGILLYASASHLVQLAERQDSRWSIDTVRQSGSSFHLAYDTAGSPGLAFGDGYYVLFSERRETTWTSKTLGYYDPSYIDYDGPHELVYDSLDRPYICWVSTYHYHSLYVTFCYAYRDDSMWVSGGLWEGNRTAGVLAFDARDTGQMVCCSNIGDSSFYKRELLEPRALSWARVRLDSAARPHLIMPWGDVVEHRYMYDGRWHRDTVMLQSEGSVANLCYSSYGDFLVLAFIRNGVPWIAWRGVPHPAVTERSSDVNASFGAMGQVRTVVRGVLLLPEAVGHKPQPVSLLDISGRRRLELKPGANDVRALAPGVYFIRTAQAQAQAQSIRKVVVTR